MLWKFSALMLVLIGSFTSMFTLHAQTDATACAAPADAVIGESTEYEIDFDGDTRRYLLYIPESYDASATPALVMSLHGFGSNPQDQQLITRWNDVADENGFVVVYPEGSSIPLRWNYDETGLLAIFNQADDVGFIETLIDQLIESYCVDSARVYATGMSNGAGMTHRLACELEDRIAAVGMVAGSYPALDADCELSRPIPIIAFHGTADPIVPFEGGIVPPGTNLPNVSDAMQTWADRLGCTQTSSADLGAVDYAIATYTTCDDDSSLVFYTIYEGGHTWPGAPSLSPEDDQAFGITSPLFASEIMWEFFLIHHLIQPVS